MERIPPKEFRRLLKEVEDEENSAIELAYFMKKVFTNCLAHGYPIYKIRGRKIEMFEQTFDFHNLECVGPEYCNVDITTNIELLKLLDGKTPLSRDKPLSETPEPDLEKASLRISDYCPYCSKTGGVSYAYARLPSPLGIPKTLQKYKMDCGHEFAIIFNIR